MNEYRSIEIRKLEKGYLISKNEPVSSLPLPVAAAASFEQVVATLREMFGEKLDAFDLGRRAAETLLRQGDLGGKYMKPKPYSPKADPYKAVADEIYKAAPQAKPALKFPSEKEDFDDCA